MVAAIAAVPAAAQTATDYNIYTLQNYTANGGQISGKVAVGGNANFSNTTVASNGTNGQTSLAVGGNFNATQGELSRGNAVVGGTATTSAVNYASNGTITAGTSPLNFSAENSRLQTLSDTLATYTANGTSENYYGNLKLTGTSSGLNVFNISAADLTGWGLNFYAPSGSQILVNVSGSSASVPNSIELNGISSSMVLFNFYEATTLNLTSYVKGSVLAADAAVTFNSGQMDGTLIANSLSTGSVGFNGGSYQGGLLTASSSSVSAVPEPASWGMMIGGFLIAGVVIRRNKATLRSALR